MRLSNIIDSMEMFGTVHGNVEVEFVDVKAEYIEVTYVNSMTDETEVEEVKIFPVKKGKQAKENWMRVSEVMSALERFRRAHGNEEINLVKVKDEYVEIKYVISELDETSVERWLPSKREEQE